MNKTEAFTNVAEKLFASEASLDLATVQTAQLLEAMITTRQELEMSAAYGEVAQARVTETIAALAEARRSIMAAHTALEAIRRKHNVTIMAGGPTQQDKDDAGTKPLEGKLRVAG